MLFLLSFVSLLLLLSLLFTLLDEAPEPDDEGAGSFLMIVAGGDPSSCLIEVATFNCSDEPKTIDTQMLRLKAIEGQ